MKKIKAWMHRHHNSISSFMSNFIATVLGIVLTLGTTVLHDHHQKEEAAKVLVEQCDTSGVVAMGRCCYSSNWCLVLHRQYTDNEGKLESWST